MSKLVALAESLLAAFVFAVFLFGVSEQAAVACPERNGIVDLNCDGKVQITAFGDSITRGTKDGSGLGYPGRLRLLVPNTFVSNFGNPGERTTQGRVRALQVFTAARATDYGIIMEGVNDYYEERSVSVTQANLLSMLANARNAGGIINLGTLVDNRRSFQRPWVLSVNNAIRPWTTVDFFSLGQGILSSDDLHPGNTGYQRMAEYVLPLIRNMSAMNRPVDADNDGIYDFAESRFGALTGNADTDGDGVSDGAEVFTYFSKPDNTDSDDDGFQDGYEVNTLGSNPADPRPGPPNITEITVINP